MVGYEQTLNVKWKREKIWKKTKGNDKPINLYLIDYASIHSSICLHWTSLRQLTSRATILRYTPSLMLISTSNSDRRLSASVLAVRTSLQEETCCGKSNMFLWTEAGERKQQRHNQCGCCPLYSRFMKCQLLVSFSFKTFGCF